MKYPPTLLDVLAGRKTGGQIDGDILINERPKDKFSKRMVRPPAPPDATPAPPAMPRPTTSVAWRVYILPR